MAVRGLLAAWARTGEIWFPRRCAGCGAGPWPFCEDCRARLIVLRPPWCARCGRPWPRSRTRCTDCPPEPVATARAPFAFKGPARAAVHRLKFSWWRGVAHALARAMVTVDPDDVVDVVTWVPLSRRRLAERGFDQAHLLASAVARERRLACASLLRRAVPGDGGAQARRGGADRRSAMRGAFDIARDATVPARILLIDDVLTTGATAAACAQTLRSAGAEQVHVLTAARAFAGSAYTRGGPGPGLWLPGGIPR